MAGFGTLCWFGRLYFVWWFGKLIACGLVIWWLVVSWNVWFALYFGLLVGLWVVT